MKILLSFLAILIGISVIGQDLSYDFNNPTQLNINQECIYTEFSITNHVSNELAIPNCDRYYQNFNRYLQITVPESGVVDIAAKFNETAEFGMAIYKMQDLVWTEIRCDYFRDGNGVIRIFETDGLSGETVLIRIWIVNNYNQNTIEICAYENENNLLSPKLITINTTTYTVSQLVTQVLVTGCLQASNVTFQGGSNAIGYFTNAIPGLNFAEGIIMSTGSVFDAPGPNTSGSTSTINNSGSDPQLQSLMPGYTINDATVLQFDFIPASNTLEFKYVFGSEEYPEFVNSSYNDVFAFFLTGPNPSGGNYNNTNIALIPSTSIPVTIDNVNQNTNSQYYISNTNGSYLEYDGLTVTLTASANVVQCATYHIKLAVGDCGDSSYDSAVFLKAGSFTSGESYTMQAYNVWANALNFYEGCNQSLVFTRTDNTSINQPVQISLQVGGTATSGVDYTPIPTTLTIPAGQQSLTIEISAFADNITEGIETITFTFANGCPCNTQTSTTTIYIHDNFSIAPTITNNGPICIGDAATFNLALNQSGATSEVQIIWSTGHTDVTTVTINPTTTTTVTATIIYPCDTVVVSNTITVINPPIVNLVPDFEVSGFTAPIDANPAAGNTGVWTYVNGPGNATIGSSTSPHTTATVDDFGTYSYVWTETSLPPNCVSSDTLNVTYYHIPTTDFYITPVSCYGDTATITYLGNGFNWATYQWDFGDGVVISGSHWGPYTVRWDQPGFHNVSLQITELNAVVDTTLQVFIPTPLTYTTSFVNDPCYHSCGGSAQVTVSGGTPPYQYHWGSSTNQMTNLCAGQYIITVNDHNACSFTHLFNIDEPTPMAFDTIYGNVDCYGNSTGWAEVIPNGGTPPYTCMWSDGYVGNHHANLTAGTYTVTISDNNGCTLFEQFKITQPNLLQLAVSPSLSICENTTIIISAQAMGGTLPYVYWWDFGDGNGYVQDVPSFQQTPHSDISYQVYVVDAHNCQTEPKSINIIVSPTMTHSFNLEHVKCFNNCDGRAEISIQGGIPPFSYSWNSPNHIITGLCEGVHTLTVTDHIGCNFQTHFVINEPPELVGSISSTPATCFGEANGTASVLVNGGTLPYSYLWPNNSTTNTMTNGAGTYTVTVTDANNCRIEKTITISEPNQLVSHAVSNQNICIGGTATVSAQSAGGTGYTNFHWEGSDGSIWNTHLFHPQPTTTTNYYLTITDHNGCSATDEVTVFVYPSLKIESITTNQDTLCVGDSTIIYVQSSGGNGGPYTLTLNNGVTVPSPFRVFPTTTTTYYVNLKDDCESPSVRDSITIYVMPTPTNNFTINPDSGCVGVPLAFNELSEPGDFTYFWDFGDGGFARIQNPYHAYQESGIYSVSLNITSKYGCSKKVTKQNAIEIFNNPTANFITTPEEASILKPVIKFTNYSSDASFYYWYYGDGDSTVYITHPQHYYEAPGEYLVKLVAKTIHNCADTTYRTIMIVGEVTLYAPEAFTPNGDGVNDCFRVCGNMIDPHSFHLKIYDRWGQKIFETEKYVTDESCNSCVEGSWDGTLGSRLSGDKYLPIGLYFWRVEFKDLIGIKHEKSGVVRLLR